MRQFVYATLALSLAGFACQVGIPAQVLGSGNIVEKEYDVQSFDEIELDTIGEVHVEQGDTESLTIKTDDNILPLLEVRVLNGVLVLSEKDHVSTLRPSNNIIYTVTVKDLKAVTTNASGNIFVGDVESGEFLTEVNASGNITVESFAGSKMTVTSNASGKTVIKKVEADTVRATANASGNILLSGSAESIKIDVNASGEVNAGDLQAVKGDVNIQGSGRVTVWASDELRLSIDGSGDVRYYGRPALTQSISGSGDVNSLGDK